jgi:hypothetical protein
VAHIDGVYVRGVRRWLQRGSANPDGARVRQGVTLSEATQFARGGVADTAVLG